VSAQRLEDAVWDAISESLQQPQLLADEYRRRLSENAGAQPFTEERKKLGIALKRVAAQEDRVTEAYVSEAMDLDRYKEEMDKLKSHRQELDRSQREIDQRQRQKQDTQKALAHLERFCHQVSKGLTSLTFDERQQLLRLVIKQITVENGVARIDTVIPPDQDNLRNRYPEPVEGFPIGSGSTSSPRTEVASTTCSTCVERTLPASILTSGIEVLSINGWIDHLSRAT
jgi:hypothetical protein